MRFDGAFGGKHTDVSSVGHLAHHFGGRTDDSEHSAVGSILGQVLLLNGTQGFGRSRVAAENDEGTAHLKEFLDGLECEIIYYVKRARTIGGTRIIAEIDVVVLWHALTDAVKDG